MEVKDYERHMEEMIRAIERLPPVMWGYDPVQAAPHDHSYPPWGETQQSYLCDLCPDGCILCPCGNRATCYTHDADAWYFTCDKCQDKDKAPGPQAPITLKTFPAASEVCKERYYGIPCQCSAQHGLRGSRM